jgi:GR25 family glycosyltransferase involved in LPS biosynthesis
MATATATATTIPENAWDFFKHIYVISLKDYADRRATFAKNMEPIEGFRYTFMEGVHGKKNPHLKQSYLDRNIITPEFVFSDGALGCLASHRFLWEKTMMEIVDDAPPFWILILEDDTVFHPLLTNAVLRAYLENLPTDARLFKLGFLGNAKYNGAYRPYNKYWIDFKNEASFSTICYAVRSDYLGTFLCNPFQVPVDCLRIPHAYGAADIEAVLEVPADSYKSFRYYYNPSYDLHEIFCGVASVNDSKSETHDPAIKLVAK